MNEERIKELIECAEELADLMDDVRGGDYKPDSFTTQPIRNAIREARQIVESMGRKT